MCRLFHMCPECAASGIGFELALAQATRVGRVLKCIGSGTPGAGDGLGAVAQVLTDCLCVALRTSFM